MSRKASRQHFISLKGKAGAAIKEKLHPKNREQGYTRKSDPLKALNVLNKEI